VIAETANAIILRGRGGVDQPLKRDDLQEFVGSGRSPMPEGLEQVITPQQMGDLISFLRASF
jgi:hypothetical protein